jgi:hypothetical protein
MAGRGTCWLSCCSAHALTAFGNPFMLPDCSQALATANVAVPSEEQFPSGTTSARGHHWGMRWRRNNAEAVLALRVYTINTTWEQESKRRFAA